MRAAASRFPAPVVVLHHGIPCERWLRILLNRVDPILVKRRLESWVAAAWPDRPDFITIDGKTARRTHDRRKGIKALHTLIAYGRRAHTRRRGRARAVTAGA